LKLFVLHDYDVRTRVFGADSHRYLILPPCPDDHKKANGVSRTPKKRAAPDGAPLLDRLEMGVSGQIAGGVRPAGELVI
jgi:hypothetical protein